MPRTAIIAVHGVGSPPAFETARNVADLLVQYGAAARGDADDGAVAYTGFTEQHVTIPTAPVVVPRASAAPGRTAGGANAPRSSTQRLLDFSPGDRDRTTFAPNDVVAQMDVDVAFMRDQLVPYEQASPREPYSTIELVGERVDRESREELHVFEMYWADLSRLGTGIAAVLGALYQLVLHIAHLGRKTLDLAAQAAALGPMDADRARAWQRLADAHDRAVRLFTVAVPSAMLLMLACLALFVPDAVRPGMPRLVTGTVILDVALITLLGLRFYFRDGAESGATRFVYALIALVAAGGALVAWHPAWLGGPYLLGTIVLRSTSTLLVIAAYWYSLNMYDQYAAGALSWGGAGFVATFVGALIFAPRFVGAMAAGTGEELRFAAFGAFQVSYVVLMVAWLLIWAAALMAYAHSWRMTHALRKPGASSEDARQRAERAMWTAKVTLGAPLFGFVLTTLVAYETLAYLAARLESRVDLFPSIAAGHLPPLLWQRLVPPIASCPPAAHASMLGCAQDMFSAIIAQSGTVGLPIGLGAAVLTFLLVSPFVALIAVTALRRPQSQVTYAENLGNWLTGGLAWIRRSGSILVLLLVIALSIGLLATSLEIFRGMVDLPFDSISIPLFRLEWTSRVLKAMAVIVVGAGAIGGVFHRVQTAVLKARPAIGIVLDVDNYLRQSPADATPRARIAERYASLLRHVLNRRDADGTPFFDRVVIVSHSQGTVISADFLRFLTVAGVAEPNVTTVDLRVLTMGSPLRQLYAANFPHLYDWVDRTDSLAPGTRPDDDAAFDARGIVAPARMQAAGAPQSLAERSPSPSWLRAAIWVNLFTSGDYVGRPLWQTQDTGGIWRYQSFQHAMLGPGRRERCLGDGTHTRYWTSADVAAELDEQLRRRVPPALRTPVPTSAAEQAGAIA